MFGISTYFESKLTPKIAFSDYVEKIAITDSRLEFGENSCGETVAIIGKLKNESDTDQENDYSFILPANEEVPFKVSIKKEFDAEKYHNYKIRLVSARAKLKFFVTL